MTVEQHIRDWWSGRSDDQRQELTESSRTPERSAGILTARLPYRLPYIPGRGI
ncbi:MAG TPA: hypothetical protein VII18_20080 [Mycobacterium sp.]|jgi:hypothetical protein